MLTRVIVKLARNPHEWYNTSMPRYRENDYNIYPRALGDKTVFYYYYYDRDGKRSAPRSTGVGFTRKRDEAKKRKEAEAYVKSLYDSGKLSHERDVKTLSQFVESRRFFDWYKSTYVRGKLARSERGEDGQVKRAKITQGYIEKGGRVFKQHIEPYHGDKYIDEIGPEDCDDLLFLWVDNGLSQKTANNNRSYYSTIMKEAKRLGVIKVNPWDNVEGLAPGSKRKGAFSVGEVKKFLDQAPKEAQRERLYYYATKLAFMTGMRISEIVGLLTDDIIDRKIEQGGQEISYSYVRVEKQWSTELKRRVPVKDKDPRDIPIMPELRAELDQFLTGKGRFLFSFHPEQKTPITGNRLRDWLYDVMESLEISRIDDRGRTKTFHSTRRFLNTLLKMNSVDGDLVRKFTGHDSDEMTEHYTDYLPEDLKVISEAQSKLLDKNTDS